MEQNPLLGSQHGIKDEDIRRALQKQDIPTNDDIQILLEQIETLTKKIDSLE